MKKTTRVLACIWLALGGLGALTALALACLLAVAYARPPSQSGDAVFALPFLMALSLGLAVLWAAPLTVGGALTLRRRAWGWRILLGHSALASVGWLLACKSALSYAFQAIRDRIEHGPNWGGYPEAPLAALGIFAMAAFSMYTVASLLRDRADGWQADPAQPAASESTEVTS